MLRYTYIDCLFTRCVTKEKERTPVSIRLSVCLPVFLLQRLRSLSNFREILYKKLLGKREFYENLQSDSASFS
jgi:hypothetical protein